MSAGPQQDGKPRRLTMLLLDEYQVERMFQKTHQFGTAAVGLGLSSAAAISANLFLATTFTSFLSGDFGGGGGGGQQQQQAPQQQRQQPQAERVQQQAREAQSALAKDRKRVALASGGGSQPDTLLTGGGAGGGIAGIPGIADEDLNLGIGALV
jgi:hypothetical protein